MSEEITPTDSDSTINTDGAKIVDRNLALSKIRKHLASLSRSQLRAKINDKDLPEQSRAVYRQELSRRPQGPRNQKPKR